MNLSGAASASASLSIGSIAPVLTPIGELNATAELEFNYTVTAEDINGDTLTFSDNTSLFVINSSTGLINFTPLITDVGDHSINISVSDGSLRDEETITFFVTDICGDAYCSSSESCSSCSTDCGTCPDEEVPSSVGGGGGGSRIPTTVSEEEPIEDVNEGITTETETMSETIWDEIDSSVPVEVPIDSEEIPVIEITFEVTENIAGDAIAGEIINPSLAVSVEESFPEEVGDVDSKVSVDNPAIYSRLEINPGGPLSSAAVESAEIYFTVTKEWLEDNGVTSKYIAMYRFVDGSWTELVTYLTGETSSGYNYVAETPGFSYFTIAETKYEIEEKEILDCSPIFTCSSYEDFCFVGDIQTRNCYDDNGCTIGAVKETRICTTEIGGVDRDEDCTSEFICTDWEPSKCAVGELRERTCYDEHGCVDSILTETRICLEGDEGAISGEAISTKATRFAKDKWMILSLVLFAILVPIVLWRINSFEKDYEISDLHAEIDGHMVHIRTVARTNRRGESADVIEQWDSDVSEDFVLEERKGKV